MARTTLCTVVGVFSDRMTAERVAGQLSSMGIARSDIQVTSGSESMDYDKRTTSAEHEGGISGFFHRLFGDDSDDAGKYSNMVERGHAVVTVTATEAEADRAAEFMNENGAINIDQHDETARGKRPAVRAMGSGASLDEPNRFARDEHEQSIPVVEEHLEVGKRVVQRGGVRVYSHVVEQPVEEQITLREEHVRVERRPADRAVDPGELSRLRDQTIEMTETVEKPVISKRARVKEEVVVGKETTERTEQVRDTVRRTEVKVDRLDAERGGTADSRADFRRDFDANYASMGGDYTSYEPAYDYGYQMANDPRYRGKSWSDVESDLQTDYMRRNPGSTWDRMKGAVRYGWERVTGKR